MYRYKSLFISLQEILFHAALVALGDTILKKSVLIEMSMQHEKGYCYKMYFVRNTIKAISFQEWVTSLKPNTRQYDDDNAKLRNHDGENAIVQRR